MGTCARVAGAGSPGAGTLLSRAGGTGRDCEAGATGRGMTPRWQQEADWLQPQSFKVPSRWSDAKDGGINAISLPPHACLLETPVFTLSMPSGCSLGVGLSSARNGRKGRCRGLGGAWGLCSARASS